MVIDSSIISHQPVSVNACEPINPNDILLHLLLHPIPFSHPTHSWTLEVSLYMQSISVVKLFCVCGDSAVNPPAAWTCHVPEHVVISRYIFCTVYFFPFAEEHQAERLQNVCYWGLGENLIYKYAVANNQCVIHLWCDVRWFYTVIFKYSDYSLCMTGYKHSFLQWAWNMTEYCSSFDMLCPAPKEITREITSPKRWKTIKSK